MFCIIGSPNAAVFPVPVRAFAIKFVSPVSKRGIAKIWIGEGVTKPFFSTALSAYSSKPKSSNVTVSFSSVVSIVSDVSVSTASISVDSIF